MHDKKSRGVVLPITVDVAPNMPPDHYVFTDGDESNPEHLEFVFRVFGMPGMVSPREFASDVDARHPLPGDICLFAPQFDFGRFDYVRPNGDCASTRLDYIRKLSFVDAPAQQTQFRPPLPNPTPQPEPKGRTLGW